MRIGFLKSKVVDSFYVSNVVYCGLKGLDQDKFTWFHGLYLIFKLLLHARVVEKYFA
jgi:hypothetical protein